MIGVNKVTFSEGVIKNAQKIVDECMGLEDAYCQSRCPMSTDVKKYVNLIAQKKYDEAIKVIREKLFLPNTLGRICAHPCEKDCRRGVEFNQPIAIAALKRFAAEKADNESIWDIKTADPTGKKVAIVGAGPAGAQAAIDLRKKGHSVTIFDKLNVVGGMMRVGIPEYRLPRHIIDHEYSYLNKLGVEFKLGVEVGKDITFKELTEKFDAVLLAHGAHKGNIIPIPGHKAEGVYSAVEYLKEISLTRKFDRAGKRIMVIGGGDVAMDCARSSWRIGASEVYQCSLEDFDNLPASKEEIHESLEEGVVFNAGWGPIEIIEKDGKVAGIKIQKVKSIFDKEGRFNPQYEGEPKVIEVDTVIMATGQLVEDITDGALVQTRGGRYEVDKDTLATKIENVFVAGDAAGGAIVIEAMALGRKAAISIDRYLNNIDLKADRDFKYEWAYETKLEIPLPEGTEDKQRLHTNMRPAQERKKDFEQCDLGFTEDQAIEEASRCLKCECKLCMRECVMMNEFGSCPKEILEGLAKEGKMEALLAYSCNGCDNCTIVCPHKLPMKDIFIGSRKDFVKANDGESPMKGHKAIKMHQLLGFSKLFTTKVLGGKK
ncbi:NADPH-dependent glutamate synthase beta chain [Alkalithermobacter thermoalcaliphilus JW-YL-7 = DSM 7308]|uniref:Glutamate synthase (NADPH) n=1 Tax=Alkalithermobacter thermoalcaliphilus JW-YL-7 = DSM 7308 TaxID=1121328 RepID=A0A150FS36_CLOPD|nr:Glutamate synthase (NADPH) [[Clostridium] paradoxum JW-YL-7 = DSM 7308]SHK32572.1 NADPH-dependent glutamate synthase beta chain [[Clostridium] paradoxum JW-YL-7 = DSM 7308]